MAFQSQTFANNNSEYYIKNLVPYVPGDQSNLAAPVEILNNTIGDDNYFSRITQTDAAGLTITENSTNTSLVNFGELMRFRMNPTGNNGPGANIGPQITLAAATQAPNLLMTSSLTEVFGTFAIGTKLNQGDNNPLKFDYSATPFPNTTITQDSVGVTQNKLVMNLNSNAADSNVAITVKNPTGANALSTQTATITPNLIQIAQTSLVSPNASLSFVAGQAAVSATTSNKTIKMIANSSGDGAINTDDGLFLTTNLAGIAGPLSVFQGNVDGTSNIPLKMYGPLASTIASESRLETTSTLIADTATSGFLAIRNSGLSDFSRNSAFNSGKITWNTIGTTRGAPATAQFSTEINNTSQNSTIGGIQFYCGYNQDIPNPRWMGGFQYADPVKEFRLESTTVGVISQLSTVSTINSQSIASFGVPVGTVLPWAGGSWGTIIVPAGYLICDGTNWNLAARPELQTLYNVIGNTYGGTLNVDFNVPDCLGKSVMGAMTASYSCIVQINSLVNVTTPTGLVKIGLYVTTYLNTRQLYVGMNCAAITGGRITKIIGSSFTNDGVNNNNYFKPPFVVLLENNAGFGGTLPANFTFVTANPSGNAANTYFPYIGNNIGSPGAGYNFTTQQTEQVGTHTHTANNGNFNSNTLAGTTAAQPAPTTNTSNNAGTYSYTDPTTSASITAPSASMIMPYNLGLNMIIKF